MAERNDDAPDGVAGIWVESRRNNATGRYEAVVTMPDGKHRTLSQRDAMESAAALVDVAVAADYDAAVVAQGLAIGQPKADTGLIVAELRRRRPNPYLPALGPVGFTPLVSAFTGDGFVDGRMGALRWQASPADLVLIAVRLLKAVAAARNDTEFWSVLVNTIGIEPTMATQVLHLLPGHVPPDSELGK